MPGVSFEGQTYDSVFKARRHFDPTEYVLPWPTPCVRPSDFRLPQNARSGLDLAAPEARRLAGVVYLERDSHAGAILRAQSRRGFNHACPDRR